MTIDKSLDSLGFISVATTVVTIESNANDQAVNASVSGEITMTKSAESSQTQVEQLRTRVVKVKEKLDEARARYQEQQDEVKKLSSLHERAMNALLKVEYPTMPVDITPAQLETLSDLAHWNTMAHDLLEQWFANFRFVRRGNMIYRGVQYESTTYPAPQLCLPRHQAQKELLVLAQELRTIAAIVDEPVVHVDIFERTLARDGAYWATFDVHSEVLSVNVTVYGRNEEIYSGPVLDALTWLATYHWYQDE
jgi:hypothetical protein